MTGKLLVKKPGQPWAGNDMERFFERIFGEQFPIESPGGVWSPSVDVSEDEHQYRVHVELPGIKPADIEVQVENNVLFISGERRMEEKKESENFHFVERSYGRFSRSFRLPKNVDSDKVDASYTDGMLNIVIPKTEEARARRIEIK